MRYANQIEMMMRIIKNSFQTRDQYSWGIFLVLIAVILVILFSSSIAGLNGINFMMIILPVWGIVGLIYLLRYPYWGLIFTVALVPLVELLPTIPFLTSFFMVIGGATLGSYLLKRLSSHERPHRTQNGLYLLIVTMTLLMLFGQLRLTVAIDRNYFLTYVQLAILIWLCEQLLNTRKQVDDLMLVYIAAVQISAFSALLDYQSNLGIITSYEYRPGGFVGNPNGLGIHLSVSMIMSFYFLRRSEQHNIRLFTTFSLILSGIVLIITGSRGAVLFFVPVLFYQLYHERIGGKLIGVLLIIIIIIMTVNLVPPEYMDRIIQIPTALMDNSDTIGLRLRLWDVAIKLWKTNPIFGIGPAMFYMTTNRDPNLLGRNHGLASHNMYVTFLTEEGIIGLAVFLGIVIVSLSLLIKAESLARRINPTLLQLIVAWQSILFILLLNGTKANNGEHKILWLCFGMAIVLMRLSQASPKSLEYESLGIPNQSQPNPMAK